MTRQPPPNGDTGVGAQTGDRYDRQIRPSRDRLWRWLVLAIVGCLTVTAALSGAVVGSADASTTADAKKVDIVFVVDSSESMNTVRSELANNIGVLQKQLEGDGIDTRYGVVSYDKEATVRQPLTGDYSKFEQAMNFETGGNFENASKALLTATGMDFRPDAEQVIVLVTDEDDDSPMTVRQQAFSELSGANFIAVSQSTDRPQPPSSWCPCDNNTANEPPKMAEAVGGDWLDVTQSRADILQAVGKIVTAEILDIPGATAPEDGTEDSTGSGESGATDGSPSVEAQSVTTNESSIEVGERIAVTVTLTNDGSAPGEFEAFLHLKESPDDFGFSVIGTRSVEVPADGTREVTFTTTFDSSRDYYLYTAGADTTVSVVEREPTSIQTTVEDTKVTASVSDPEPGESVEITLGGVPLDAPDTSGTDADDTSDDDTTNASVQSGRTEPVGTLNVVRVTPATERDFTVTVARWSVGQNGTVTNGTDAIGNATSSFPAGVEPVSVLSLDSSLPASAFESVTLEYTVESSQTRLYRYDDGAGEWVRAETTLPNATAGAVTDESRRVVTRTDGAALFAVVETQPVFEVVDASVDSERVTAGELVQTTVTVENTGTQSGEYTAALTVDGETVATAEVSVPVNATETVVFNYRPQTAGESTVSVNGTVAGTITVESAESDGAESTTTTSSQTGTETATRTATATATASVTPTPAATATDSTDETATATRTATEPAATDSLSGGQTTDGSAPGFTPATLAVAILVLSLLSLRRRW